MAHKTHALIRTNRLGDKFIGRCMQCGKDGLTLIESRLPCDNPDRLSEEDTIIRAIEGKGDSDEK